MAGYALECHGHVTFHQPKHLVGKMKRFQSREIRSAMMLKTRVWWIITQVSDFKNNIGQKPNRSDLEHVGYCLRNPVSVFLSFHNCIY